MSATAAFGQMAILFFGIIVGFIAAKLKIIDDVACKVITNVVMNVTLPFFIVSTGITTGQTLTPLQMLQYFGLSLVCYAMAYFLGLAAGRLPLFDRKDRRLCSFMTTFGNTGFMGLPFIAGLFGSDALFYATIFNLPFNFLVFSIGIYLVSEDTGDTKINPKMFVNACLIASVLAIVLYLLNLQLPELAVSCLNTVGSATVPMAMLITGARLAQSSFKSVFADPGLYVLSLIKIAIVPLFAYGLLSIALSDPTLIRVGVLLSAMPVATNATMLCLQYGGNDDLASRGVFLSTLLSIVTIPLLVLFMG